MVILEIYVHHFGSLYLLYILEYMENKLALAYFECLNIQWLVMESFFNNTKMQFCLNFVLLRISLMTRHVNRYTQ